MRAPHLVYVGVVGHDEAERCCGVGLFGELASDFLLRDKV